MHCTQFQDANLLCISCIGDQKLRNKRGSNFHYDEVEMGPHSLLKFHSKSTTEPQYEECGGCVTNSRSVAMEANLAYSVSGCSSYKASLCVTTLTTLMCAAVNDCMSML